MLRSLPRFWSRFRRSVSSEHHFSGFGCSSARLRDSTASSLRPHTTKDLATAIDEPQVWAARGATSVRC